MLNRIGWNRADYLHKIDLALNNQQKLICHKNQTTNQSTKDSEMDVYEFLIRQEVHEDVHYISYKTICIRGHEGQQLFSKLKTSFELNMLWIFSDKKNFCQNQIVNSRNKHCIATYTEDVLI